jgi:serine/threonine protein kinase
MDTPTFPRDAPQDLASLHHCIDALVRGDWTEEEFLSGTLDLLEAEADLNWDALAYIDQRYRRGQLDERTFQSIKSQIAQRAVGDSGAQGSRDGVTVELYPARRPAPVKPASVAATGNSGEEVLAGAFPRPAVPASVVPGPAVRGPAADRPGKPALEIGQVLRDRYRVTRLLGRGGMGDVYEALDVSGDAGAQPKRRVAIKVLRERFDQRPELTARLRREFECTRKLSHPNIVKVFEFDRVDDWAFYTMELLEGERVDDMLAREAGRPLPRPYVWALIGAIGAALAHAHSRNVIHGDLSPKNVMITPGGEVRVLDFGSSTMSNVVAVPADTRVEGAVATTPAYASCELLEGLRADPRDDLYSLACIAFELLAGARPFPGKRSSEARDEGIRPRRPPGLNYTQWRTLQMGLSWARDARSLSVRQWLARLGLEPEPECLPLLSDLGAKPRLRRAGMAVAAILIAAAAGSITAPRLFHSAADGADPTAQSTPEMPQIADASPAAADAAPAAAGPPPASADSGPAAPIPAIPEPAPVSSTPVVTSASPAPLPRSAVAPATEGSPTAAPAAVASAAVAVPAVRSEPIRRPPMAAAAAPRPAFGFTAHRYFVRRGAHFVETRVWRSRGSEVSGNFVWWTNDSSARAGIDFVAQAPTPHPFASAGQQASLYVRLLPNPHRTQNVDFRVCLGRTGAARSANNVSCSSVLLPAVGDPAS